MIKVGTSGFQFADWVGPVYAPGTRPQSMLNYYETILGFSTVELNYTYYAMPAVKTMHSMLKKTSDTFEFAVRSHKDMTHDIWTDQSRKTLKDTSSSFMQFRYGIQPLIDEARLGCILIQFPYYFYPTQENRSYLTFCNEQLKGLPVVIEFRNRSWVNRSTFSMLKEQGIGFCVVDEPPLPGLMPTVFEATSSIGYVRLHGRNHQWFKASKNERYNYDYSKTELAGFVPSIKQLARRVETLFVF
ncbi:MAG: DUF72 domain-containing protein, partial [Elusimicrobia bacterium]|nr:DUF72 domain-containing protein [Elusimicrobiota bacterium]MBD3412228.1 DUF72 domain-containing protein [Elusimicrobiota bacterium]